MPFLFLDHSMPSGAENLALDEALLECVEKDQGWFQTLRIWEPDAMVVIAGRGTVLEEEIHTAACREHQIPVFRRTTGGCAILIGQGCLMYSVTIRNQTGQTLFPIPLAHQMVLDRHVAMCENLGIDGERAGMSDLVVGDKKLSGNSLRIRQHGVLYHGTFLYDFDLSMIEKVLKKPPREPDYRAGRKHSDFMMNLPVERAALCEALRKTWDCEGALKDWPKQRTEQIAKQLADPEWINQR